VHPVNSKEIPGKRIQTSVNAHPSMSPRDGMKAMFARPGGEALRLRLGIEKLK
jgi:hypothetical protein